MTHRRTIPDYSHFDTDHRPQGSFRKHQNTYSPKNRSHEKQHDSFYIGNASQSPSPRQEGGESRRSFPPPSSGEWREGGGLKRPDQRPRDINKGGGGAGGGSGGRSQSKSVPSREPESSKASSAGQAGVKDCSSDFLLPSPQKGGGAGGSGSELRGTAVGLVQDPHKLVQRAKQLDHGFNTRGYQRYRNTVPKAMRDKARANEDHPVTPNIHKDVSKRAFDGMVRKWRRQLHAWDPEVSEEAKVDVTGYKRRVGYEADAPGEVATQSLDPTSTSAKRIRLDQEDLGCSADEKRSRPGNAVGMFEASDHDEKTPPPLSHEPSARKSIFDFDEFEF